MTVAYHGVPGAFSHEACLRFLPGEKAVGLPSFADVIRAVEAGESDLGVLPLENNNVGAVEEVRQLLDRSPLRVVARQALPIRIHLLALPGASIDQVRTAVSHPMAIKQCRETLRSLGRARPPPRERSTIRGRPCSRQRQRQKLTGLSS